MDNVSRALLSAGGGSVSQDPLRNYVTLMLKSEGPANSTNNTFLDSSTNNYTITRNGNTTQGTFSPHGDNWSNYFGSANYIFAASNAAFSPGTGDFTVEAWVYPDSAYTTFNYILGVAASNGLVFYITGGNLVVRSYNGSDLLASATIPALNTWTHVAATRSGTTLRIFVNGVQTASTTNSTNFAQGAAYVGNDSTNAAPWYGYISNFRFVKGTAVYTSNFTPSTTPLTAISGTSLLTCQSNRFVDNSSNNFTITRNGSPSVQRFSPFPPTAAYTTAAIGGSGYFDGNGDSLQAPSGACISGAGDFTAECWAYPTVAAATYSILACSDASGGLTMFGINNSGTVFMGRSLIDVQATSSNAVQYNAWNHIAVSRSSGTVRIFVNGVQGYSGTITTGYSSGTVRIGTDGGGSALPYTGYVSNFRIINNAAIYTANFTPPTGPLTNITNTSMLCNFTNAGIFDETAMNNLETVGSTQISTTGGGSMSFNGSGNYLTLANVLNTNLGSGPFTIEFWVRFTSATGTQFVLSNYQGATVGYGVGLSGGVVVFWATGDGPDITSGFTPSNNVWYHIAVSGQSGAIRLFIDGTQYGSTYTGATALDSTATLRIGDGQGAAFPQPFTGFLDDLRITKAIRYTSNFTRPTDLPSI